MAVQLEQWHARPRREVDVVDFGRQRPLGEAAGQQHTRLEAALYAAHPWAPIRAPAQSVKRNTRVIDVRPGFEIIDRPLRVFDRLDSDVAFCIGTLDIDLTLVGPLVNRKHDRPSAPHRELEKNQADAKSLARPQHRGIGPGVIDQDLIGRRGVLRQEQIGGHVFVAISRREGDFFLAPVGVRVVSRFHARIERSFVVRIQSAVSREDLVADGFLL